MVDAPDDLGQEALSAGIFMAGINDEQFKLDFPKIFSSKPVKLIGVVDEYRLLVWLRMVTLLKFGLNDEPCFWIQCWRFYHFAWKL